MGIGWGEKRLFNPQFSAFGVFFDAESAFFIYIQGVRAFWPANRILGYANEF